MPLAGFIILCLLSFVAFLVFVPEKQPSVKPQAHYVPSQQQTAKWQEYIVPHQQSIQSLLLQLGIDAETAHSLLQHQHLNPDTLLSANSSLKIHINTDGKPDELRFFYPLEHGEKQFIVLKKENNQWRDLSAEQEIEQQIEVKHIPIRTSAQGALAQAGIDVNLRETLRLLFREQVNIDQLQTGDSIHLVLNTLLFREHSQENGMILAAKIIHQGVHYQAYFVEKETENAYFDGQGKWINTNLDFTTMPVKGKVSSVYGMRKHPILHTLKMHTGIDFAAAEGTPIYAPADGMVQFRGWKNGYGNTLILKHHNGIETWYAHLSAFADTPVHINAGQIIAFVGSTGRSTGPHLHYEARIADKPINPNPIALPNLPNLALLSSEFPRQKTQADKLLHTKTP